MNARIKVSLKEPDIDNRLLDERGPTKQRLAKTGFDIGDTGTITIRQSPVERGVKRGTLTEQQGTAAQKFYMHWYRAQLAGTIGSSDPLKVFSTVNDFSRLRRTEASAFHYWALIRATTAVHNRMENGKTKGDHAVGILSAVVLHEYSLEKAGRAVMELSGTPALVMAGDLLRRSLDILIEEWGL